MSTSDEFGVDQVQRLLDEQAIRACLADYCRAADRQDVELLRSVYHSDALDHHGFYDGGVDGFVDWFTTRHRDVIMSMHIIANCRIHFTATSRAVAETYCTTIQRLRPVDGSSSSVETHVLCRYVDVFESRASGVWKILERTVIYETVSSGDVADVELPPGARQQRHGTDDPGHVLVAGLVRSSRVATAEAQGDGTSRE